jgi:hypothetical protein
MRPHVRVDPRPIELIGVADGREAGLRDQADPPSSARTAPVQKLDALDAK